MSNMSTKNIAFFNFFLKMLIFIKKSRFFKEFAQKVQKDVPENSAK